jgi:hypothetical protein
MYIQYEPESAVAGLMNLSAFAISPGSLLANGNMLRKFTNRKKSLYVKKWSIPNSF